MENDHECHKLDYGWVWHKLTWATYGGAAMRAADPAARSSSPHLAAQSWGGAAYIPLFQLTSIFYMYTTFILHIEPPSLLNNLHLLWITSSHPYLTAIFLPYNLHFLFSFQNTSKFLWHETFCLLLSCCTTPVQQERPKWCWSNMSMGVRGTTKHDNWFIG